MFNERKHRATALMHRVWGGWRETMGAEYYEDKLGSDSKGCGSNLNCCLHSAK